MIRRAYRHPGHVTVAAAAVVLAGFLVSESTSMAQRGGGGGPVLVPTTAASVLLDPEAFLGRQVSMMATVDEMLSATAFTVDQDQRSSDGPDVLVLVPTLQPGLEANSYVTVVGRLLRFDPEVVGQLASDYELDLAPDVIARYRDQPMVLAAAVVTPALEDLAKVPPPPLTPEEEAFDGVMKQVSAANGALRGGLQASNAEQVREPLASLATAFGEAEAFFAARDTQDAVEWAREAQQQVAAMQTAVADGDWDAAGEASSALAQLCSACHGAHRMQLDDGSYRVRPSGGGR